MKTGLPGQPCNILLNVGMIADVVFAVAVISVTAAARFAKGPETVGGENAAFMSRRLMGRFGPITLAFSAIDPSSPCTCDA